MSVALNDYIAFFVRQSENGGLYTLSSPTQLFGANDDEGTSANIAFPWEFPFSTGSYSHWNADTNGHMALTKGSGSPTSALGNLNSSLDTNHNTNIFAPWWSDVETAQTDGYVRYENQTDVSPQRVIVEWNINASYTHATANHTKGVMQCVMKQNGNIEFRYGPLTVGGNGGNSYANATIGLKEHTDGGEHNHGHIRSFGWFAKGGDEGPHHEGAPIGSKSSSSGSIAENCRMSGSHSGGAPNIHWPGSDDNMSALSASYNILFIRDPSEYSSLAFGGERGPAGGHNNLDGDFVINIHKNASNERSTLGPAELSTAVAEISGTVAANLGASTGQGHIAHGLSTKGPISLRGRAKAYSVSSGGDPDQTTT